MKILLIGEFSGVHNNLKKGLSELGHDVKLVADGDGFKKFSSDIAIRPYVGRYLGRIFNIIYVLLNINKFIGYDVVQFISPFSLPTYMYRIGILRFIINRNKKIIYYACGTDPNYIKISKQLDYHPYNGNKYFSPKRVEYYTWFINQVDVIVPATYTYYLAYKNNNKLVNCIMLPGSGDYIDQVNKPGDKLNILFGITRKDFKGSEYIEEALEKIKLKYSNRVNIKIVERLPFNEYKLLLNDTDILIDQCKSYSYGMNTIFAMEKGIIVMSGSEKKSMDYFGFKDCPVINIIPNPDQIESRIKKLLEKSVDDLLIIKKKSLDYSKKYHNPRHVSNNFLKVYR